MTDLTADRSASLTDRTDELRHFVQEAHDRLTHHPLFAALENLDDVRQFMEWHVFAVWDFVSLLKRLQRDLTCVTLPWTPPSHPRAARLINEIVLGEESDETPDGGTLSHYELYLGAMREIGADTGKVEAFVASLRQGIALEAALARAELPAPVASFVRTTLQTALNGELEQVLGSFFFGRENVIPAMFGALLARWGVNRADAPLFTHYLERHIELDRGDHGPKAASLIDDLIGSDAKREEIMLTSALAALRQRDALWNALHAKLQEMPELAVAE
jgi:hypothetical protein